MTPQEFIHKWRPSRLRERQASQEHFIDLCRVLEEPTPAEGDSEGISFCFDYGAAKTGGGDGFADVWKKGCFGWEYKGKHKDLIAAYARLKEYADDLQNPPLLIVSDMDRIVIRTNFTNTVQEIHTISLDDIALVEKRRLLKWAFTEPERLTPNISREQLTETAAGQFSELAQRLRGKNHEPLRVAHFMIKMLFCMFAEHINILPSGLFTRLLEAASRHPQQFEPMAKELFSAMGHGGRFGTEIIDWFDGGLFDDDDTIEIEKPDIDQISKVSQLDWSSIEPSIFGTLFERGLDPSKRSQLGAHFTDQRSIMRIVEPVVLAPLRAEWESVKAKIAETMREYRQIVKRPGPPGTDVQVRFGQSKEELAPLQVGRSRAATTAAANRLLAKAKDLCRDFLSRLENFRVLDPACGSGNFLYLSLLGLKDLEQSVIMEAEQLGLERFLPSVGPQSVMGIEQNPYAAELARVTVWIGQIQWMLRHGWGLSKNPILKPLDQISCRDAILNPDGTEAEWPIADCIVGNPPFLGDRFHLSVLGEDYTLRLRAAYSGRVPARADLVVYWVLKAAEKAINGDVQAFGLVATKSIAKGASRVPLDLLTCNGRELIYDAWTNEPWVVEGAKVRVSIVCAVTSSRKALVGGPRLNGQPAVRINPDLTSGIDITKAKPLAENAHLAFQGVKLTGPFDISGDEARRMLQCPLNPNGRSNADVISRLYDIDDVVGRDSDRWVIDFGTGLSEHEAALYEEPFRIVAERVVPFRQNPDQSRSTERRLVEKYWEFQRPRPKMRKALANMPRFIVTPESSEHRVFIFAPGQVLIQGSLFCIASDDDEAFGILSSRFHEIWATAQGNRLGVGNQRRYNKDVAFETFPFPQRLAPGPLSTRVGGPVPSAIAAAASQLYELRERWLNPPALARREPDIVPGYPDRLVPINQQAFEELMKRTLTELYNQRPTWLNQAHTALDEAVAAAYGWPADICEEEVLRRLLDLNLARSA